MEWKNFSILFIIFSVVISGLMIAEAIELQQIDIKENTDEYYYTYKYKPVMVPEYETVETLIKGYEDPNGTIIKDKTVYNTVRTGEKIEYVPIGVTAVVFEDKTFVGKVNVDGNRVCRWGYEIGDRDFKNYPCCTSEEINKKLCEIIYK